MEKKYLTFFSPAKINLFFKVLYKRIDGYHEIASLYQAINFGDIFHIRLSDKNKFRCDNLDLKYNDSNLIYRAIELYKKKIGMSFFVDIILDKKIPVQAGLGGGSSNAATALYAINQLMNKKLSDDELIEISNDIGSDVSFFFSTGSAYCTGRGEIFKNIPQKKLSLFLAVPNFGVSTNLVYKNLDIKKLNKNDHKKALLDYEKGKVDFFNDLEISAFSCHAKLEIMKMKLIKMGFENVVMTGSGSVFMCFGDADKLDKQHFSFYKVENIHRNSESWYPLFL